MSLLSITLLVCFSSGVQSNTFNCASNLDCSLNGHCNGAFKCECHPPWQGQACGVLELNPAKPQEIGAVYGFSPNVSSWGASILRGDDGTFHMFVAEMQTGGLVGWQTQSQCVHTVSPFPDGPFTKVDVSLEPECHGPVVIRDPLTKEYLLFHQGSGPMGSNSSGFMRHSKSPSGPWTSDSNTPGSCGMPTAAFHPNGTLFVICGNGARLMSNQAWYNSSSQWHAGAEMPRAPHWEDPSLWFDAEGNFHVLFHVYSLEPYTAKNVSIASGHAYSADGIQWFRSDVQPFTGIMDFTDGTSITFATRERPQLLFASNRRTTPVALMNGVSSQPIGPMCDTCNSHACSQCKVTPGRDWTYTVFQPFKNFVLANQ